MSITLHEIESHWSIDDVQDAHIALDLRDSLERKANKQAKGKR
jgi:hypothetical protein